MSLTSKVFSFRDESILCFRQGRVYPLKFFLLEMKVSSVSGREVKCEVLVIWKVNNS